MRHPNDMVAAMARGPWLIEWGASTGHPGGYGELDYDAPSTPNWARKWAQALADSIVKLNGKSLRDLFELAHSDGFPHSDYHFAHLLAAQATGTGLRWDDDVREPSLKIRVPLTEFYRGARVDERFIIS